MITDIITDFFFSIEHIIQYNFNRSNIKKYSFEKNPFLFLKKLSGYLAGLLI